MKTCGFLASFFVDFQRLKIFILFALQYFSLQYNTIRGTQYEVHNTRYMVHKIRRKIEKPTVTYTIKITIPYFITQNITLHN